MNTIKHSQLRCSYKLFRGMSKTTSALMLLTCRLRSVGAISVRCGTECDHAAGISCGIVQGTHIRVWVEVIHHLVEQTLQAVRCA